MDTKTVSAGHICFCGDFEYYDLEGEVYRAHVSNVMDVHTKARIGRWECTRTQFEKFRHVILRG